LAIFPSISLPDALVGFAKSRTPIDAGQGPWPMSGPLRYGFFSRRLAGRKAAPARLI
jgi:hypothetical protein